MRDVLPQDVPGPGTYDFTLAKAGISRAGRRAVAVAHFLIDAGQFRGKRVSCVITHNKYRKLMGPAAGGAGADASEMAVKLNRHRLKLRCSGELAVRRLSPGSSHDEGPRNVVISYDITGFAPPKGDSELDIILARPKAKFKRQ